VRYDEPVADFAAWARAGGGYGAKVDKPGELPDALRAALAYHGPAAGGHRDGGYGKQHEHADGQAVGTDQPGRHREYDRTHRRQRQQHNDGMHHQNVGRQSEDLGEHSEYSELLWRAPVRDYCTVTEPVMYGWMLQM